MRVAVVGHVEWIRFARVEQLPGAGRDRPLDRRLGAGRRRRRRGRDPARAARRRGAPLHGARRRRARPPVAGGARGARRARPRDASSRGRSGGRSRTSTRWASGRSRPSGRSCGRAGTTTGCPGTSSARWTRCSSSPATSRRCVGRGGRPVLTATARDIETLRRGAVELDALIGSGEDEAERYHAGDLDPEPQPRRDDLGRARRLDAAGRPVHGRAAARPA